TVHLVEGLDDGTIPPSLWRACADKMVRSADSPSAVRLLDRVVAAYARAITAQRVEANASMQARADALEAVSLERPADRPAHANVVANAVGTLRGALGRGALGSWASEHATAFVDAAD